MRECACERESVWMRERVDEREKERERREGETEEWQAGIYGSEGARLFWFTNFWLIKISLLNHSNFFWRTLLFDFNEIENYFTYRFIIYFVLF